MVLRKGISPAIDIIIEKAREPDPEDRCHTINDFCQELAQVGAVEPASRRAPGGGGPCPFSTKHPRFVLIRHVWFLLLPFSFLVSYLLPNVLPDSWCEESSFAGLLLWDVFLISSLLALYIIWLARRTGYATLVSYGPLLSTFLGVCAAGMA